MNYQSAPFWRRLAARILDLAFCLALTFVIAIPMSVLYAVAALIVGEGAMEEILLFIYVWLCYFIAYVGLEVFLLVRREGQTLGKGLLGLRVIPVDVGVSPARGIGIGGALTRMLLIFLPFVFMSFSGSNEDSVPLDVLAQIGLWSLVISLVLAGIPPSGKRRALHDFAAGTRVVKAAKRPINFKEDLKMTLPGKVDMTKRL